MLRKSQLLVALTAVAAISCSKSDDVACQPGYALCAGTCVRIGADPQHCGACGSVCGPTQACVAGACVVDCRASLHGPIDDPWGASWDGLERPSVVYTTARSSCEAIGGRLPTATEIVRAGVRTATVGDGYQTSPLWSLDPLGAATGLAVRLSDGTSAPTSIAPGVTRHYRCVCPPERPAAFTGSACFSTQAGDGCVPMPGNPALNLDAEDRPPLPRSAAMYECALAGGDLPTAEQLVAAFRSGLPNPTSTATTPVPLHTADAIGAAGLDVTVLSSNAPTFAQSNDIDFRAFRCIGPAAQGVPAAVAGGFREPRGDRVIDADPDQAATTYTAALFDCLGRGGHLPMGNELAALAIQGLPAGASAGARWTADQTSTTEVETFAWSGAAYWPVDPDLATTSPTAAGVSFDATTARRALKSAALPYRCLYYAVNPAYAPPSASACGGSPCLVVPVGTRARMWFMRSPRGGSGGDTYSAAAKFCADLGGRLPSVRDYVEAIHAGLENTSAAALTTSDFVTATDVRTLSWSGTFPADADPAAATVGAGAGSVKYVCMWTDELR